MVKIKIIKPSIKSGYFSNTIHTVDESLLDSIKMFNEIEIIDEMVINKVNDSSNRANNRTKTGNTGRSKKAPKNK